MQRPGSSRPRQNGRRPTGSMQRSNSRYRRKATWLERVHYRWPFAIPAAAAALLVILGIIIIPGLVNVKSDASAQEAQPTPVPTIEATAEPSPTPEMTTEPQITAEPAATLEAPVSAAPVANGPFPTLIKEFEVYDDKMTTSVALGLPECPRVDDSYFNDTVFIGDSVSEKLKYYVTKQRKEDEPNLLGNAVFLTAPSLSARNTLKPVTETSLHPTYRGEKMRLEDIVYEMGAKKVYIMFGLNDVGISGVKESAKNLMTLIKDIKKKSPDVLIFIQSATPRVFGERPTTQQLFKYNQKVYKYCLKVEDQGIYYVDVAHVMRDDEGKLIREYCSDLDSMALHFNNTACKKWIDFLYTHALVAQ